MKSYPHKILRHSLPCWVETLENITDKKAKLMFEQGTPKTTALRILLHINGSEDLTHRYRQNRKLP